MVSKPPRVMNCELKTYDVQENNMQVNKDGVVDVGKVGWLKVGAVMWELQELKFEK